MKTTLDKIYFAVMTQFILSDDESRELRKAQKRMIKFLIKHPHYRRVKLETMLFYQ
jgi:hypothetical protein